jgi:hypothetical protein
MNQPTSSPEPSGSLSLKGLIRRYEQRGSIDILRIRPTTDVLLFEEKREQLCRILLDMTAGKPDVPLSGQNHRSLRRWLTVYACALIAQRSDTEENLLSDFRWNIQNLIDSAKQQ